MHVCSVYSNSRGLSPCLRSTNVVMNYSEVESKVREATNDDPWGPSGQLMAEISRWARRFSLPPLVVFLTLRFGALSLF